MQGQFIFLNESHYTKDDQYKSYSNFADSDGRVISFNSAAISPGAFPKPFEICDLSFNLVIYGKSQVFVLEKISVIDRLVSLSEKEGK